MKINRLTPELIVSDVNESIKYYQDTLGFELLNKVENGGKYTWALIGLDKGIEIMLIAKSSIVDEVINYKEKIEGDDIVILIELIGVKEHYEKWKKIAKIEKELVATNYGSIEFAIRDLNGYVLMFTERNVE